MNEYIISEMDANKRIDSYLVDVLDFSRSKIQKMIKEGCILVNDKQIKNSYSLKENDKVIVNDYEEEIMFAEAENIPLDIVYEDDDVIVVNKKNGMVVHPAKGNTHGTLVNALLYH